MTVILVNLGGVILVAFIVWWFWMTKAKAQRAGTSTIDILVDGGTFTPSRIEVAAGKEVALRFFRKDASPCAERVVFDELGINVELPIDQHKDVLITTPGAGEFSFTCQMQMYRGSLVAK
ncbi:MAG: cupredoxin domain-containing protein [Gammaproteobacteria bacterium]|nr:cupredoxin domain-containing protein [Gammaproteobacteria bacterium]